MEEKERRRKELTEEVARISKIILNKSLKKIEGKGMNNNKRSEARRKEEEKENRTQGEEEEEEEIRDMNK